MRIRITGSRTDIEQVAEIFEQAPAALGWPALSLGEIGDFRPDRRNPDRGHISVDAELAWLCRWCGSPVGAYDRDPRAWVHTSTGMPRCVATDGITHADPGPAGNVEEGA